MKDDNFWSVQIGLGMGPLLLGAKFESVLEALREHDIDVDRMRLDGVGKLAVPEFGTQLVFSPTSPRVLERIDVSDDRLRFGSLKVIGKRVHEILGIFKVSRKKTLWCSVDPNADTAYLHGQSHSTNTSQELLARGTIWITSHGLGLTLCDGLIATVHLCDPAHSPTEGTGPWTKEQQLLSEVRELPPVVLTIPPPRSRISIWSVLIHLLFFAAMGSLVWWAIQLQHRWDAANEATALVVAVDPPPSNGLPTDITVSFQDAGGNEHRHTLGYLQFMSTPKLGDEVNVRFLPESPDQVLGPVAASDIGFQTALPYGVAIFMVYSVLQLIAVTWSSVRRRRVVAAA